MVPIISQMLQLMGLYSEVTFQVKSDLCFVSLKKSNECCMYWMLIGKK